MRKVCQMFLKHLVRNWCGMCHFSIFKCSTSGVLDTDKRPSPFILPIKEKIPFDTFIRRWNIVLVQSLLRLCHQAPSNHINYAIKSDLCTFQVVEKEDLLEKSMENTKIICGSLLWRRKSTELDQQRFCLIAIGESLILNLFCPEIRMLITIQFNNLFGADSS